LTLDFLYADWVEQISALSCRDLMFILLRALSCADKKAQQCVMV